MGRNGNAWRRRRLGDHDRWRLEALARSIADRSAREDIEEYCEREAEQVYVVPVFPSGSATSQQNVWTAMAYLEMRGLLVHDPIRPNIVRLL